MSVTDCNAMIKRFAIVADAVYACEVSCLFTLGFGQTIRERVRKSSHLSLSSMRLSGKHSYSVSITMVTRGPEQGMLGSLCGALSQESHQTH